MKPIIVLEDVRKDYECKDGSLFTALRDINIEIYSKQLTILKGRSGSGKTTLLNLLGALDRPSEGKILFDGQNINELSEEDRAILRRYKLGFVFQSIALIPMMSAYENVEAALRLAKLKTNRKQRVTEYLRRVGLAGRMEHMPEQMSGGEQQRVGIARAAVHSPRVILADEPTGSLDSTTGLQVIKMLKDLTRQDDVTIVITTHDPAIMALGDRGYELEDGEIVGEW
jgi:putative ABC transport system ATP-binding protein